MASPFAHVFLLGRVGIAIALGGMTSMVLLLGAEWPDVMQQSDVRDREPMRRLARRLMLSLAVMMIGMDVVLVAALMLTRRLAGWHGRSAGWLSGDRVAEGACGLMLAVCSWTAARALYRAWSSARRA